MSQAADLPIENTSAPPGPLSSLFVVTTIVGSSLLWLAGVFQTVFIVPRFEKMFLEFKMKLPLATEWVMRNGLWFVFVCLVVAVAVSLVLRKPWAWLAVLVLLPVLINLF